MNYKRGFEADIICQKHPLDEDIINNIQGIYEEKGYTAAIAEIALQLEDFAENNQIV